MRKLLLAAAVIGALASPALAEGPICQYTLETAIDDLVGGGYPHFLLDADKIDAFVATIKPAPEGKVTNVLIAELRQELHYGLEIDGCLTPPMPVGVPAPGKSA